MKLSISQEKKSAILSELGIANKAFQQVYPGEKPDRQPVHTVYGGADLFKFNSAQRMGEVALSTLLTYAPDFITFAKALHLQGHEQLPSGLGAGKALEKKMKALNSAKAKQHAAYLSYVIYNKVLQKLKTEPIEDFRIDFEDGFGNRSNQEEDETAVNAALEVAKGMEKKTLPPFIGIRIKPFTEDMKERGSRTLDIFLTALSEKTNGKLPENFVVMLPKVTIPEQVSALVKLFESIESSTSIPQGSLKCEMMVETTQAVVDSDGKNPLLQFVDAAKGRMIASAFGTYDYTASNKITAKLW